MKEIKLNKGYVATVDDDDFEFLSQFKWLVNFGAKDKNQLPYATTSFSMHSAIMKSDDKSKLVDHKNGNSLDNRKENLRLATTTQNAQNRKKMSGILGKPCASKFKGVTKSGPKWRCGILSNGKYISLGTFENEIDAAKAYNEAAIKYHGEFARPNIINEGI